MGSELLSSAVQSASHLAVFEGEPLDLVPLSQNCGRELGWSPVVEYVPDMWDVLGTIPTKAQQQIKRDRTREGVHLV